MRGSSQMSGGSEGSFTEGALSLLRSSVGSASKDFKKAAKPAGKAFQTAHDCSGWDRKARWQRAFNLARSEMGAEGMDESVDKWGTGGRDADGGDRRCATAQPARRSSLAGGGGGVGVGGGGTVMGAPGTIAELRTPVALKEHLKRGKDARGMGIQLVTLEGGGLDVPLSEQDAAAMVAQFDLRRQMLGAVPSPGRPSLTPAGRVLKAWANNNTNTNTNNSNDNDNDNNNSSFGDRDGSSTNGVSNKGSSTVAQGSPPIESASNGAVNSVEPVTPDGIDATATIATAAGLVVAAVSGTNNSNASASAIVPGGGGGSGISFSGGGQAAAGSGLSGGGGLMFQRRRFSEGGSFAAGDGSNTAFRLRIAGAGQCAATSPDSSIITQLRQPLQQQPLQQQSLQRIESASMQRPSLESSSSLRGLAQAQVPRQMRPVLPALQVPPLPLESSSPRPSGSRTAMTPTNQASSAAVAAVAAAAVSRGGSEAGPDFRRLLSPSTDGTPPPPSPGLPMAANSPIGAAAATCGSGGGGSLVPVPPSASQDSPAALAAGLRRPRPHVSLAGDGSGSFTCATPAAPSGPLPSLTLSGWVSADGCSSTDGAATASAAPAPSAAAAAAPPPSRLVMHTSPATPASHTPSRPVGGHQGYRRITTSSPGMGSLGTQTGPHLPRPPSPTSSASPPLSLRSHASQQRTPHTPTPSSPSAYRRESTSTGTPAMAVQSGGAAAATRKTPVSDAVLAGLRVVATEVADELSREAEVAAMTRLALSQQGRMRVSDSGKAPRHQIISLPGDPWRKWG